MHLVFLMFISGNIVFARVLVHVRVARLFGTKKESFLFGGIVLGQPSNTIWGRPGQRWATWEEEAAKHMFS